MANRKGTDKKLMLGMDRPITRRDLLNGLGLSAAMVATYGVFGANITRADTDAYSFIAPEKDPNYYPPTRSGLRGSHPGSFEGAHARAWQGKSWNNPVDLAEQYDLIVVGGGISGLAAAYAYREKAGADSKILIIDNHDDFGGHAKRVEFNHDGKTVMLPGGSGFLETPYFSDRCLALLEDIGVSLKRLEPGQVDDFRLHACDLSPSICFDKETYGKAVTLVDEILPLNKKDEEGNFNIVKHIPDLPVSAKIKEELLDFFTSRRDVFEGLSAEERESALHSMSYHTFITKYCGLSQETADVLFTRQPAAFTGFTTDSVSIFDAILLPEMPGLHLLGRQGEEIQKELDSKPPVEGHYAPEGNAMISRTLVKRLIPEICEEETMEDLATARFNYAKLDDEGSAVRIRLSSIGVHMKHVERGKVAVTYLRGNKPYRVTAKHCIYAGWHMYLPHLCPELPEAQKKALKENVKMPFVAVQVCFQNGKPFQELGSASFYFPGRYLHDAMVWGRPLGKHTQELNEDDPVTMYFIGPYIKPHSGLSPQEQHRQGRYKMLAMSFEDYEREVREQLVSLFASTSFDVKEDVVGITVNRWPHGYSRQYNSLFDPEYEDGQRPHEIARKRFGNIAIANADAGYVALVNVAIDEGLRAVDELFS